MAAPLDFSAASQPRLGVARQQPMAKRAIFVVVGKAQVTSFIHSILGRQCAGVMASFYASVPSELLRRRA